MCVLDCFFKQGEWCYALADYQQAEEMQPDDPAVRLRLGVLHNTLGSLCFQDGSVIKSQRLKLKEQNPDGNSSLRCFPESHVLNISIITCV